MLELFHPEFHDLDTTIKHGGKISNSRVTVDTDDPTVIFSPGLIKNSGDYIQYRKVFIKNTGTVDSTNLRISIINHNNSLISFALERDRDGLVIDGEQRIKNPHTTPGRIVTYIFQSEGFDTTLFSSESSSSSSSQSSSFSGTSSSSSSKSTEGQTSSSSSSTELSESSSTEVSETSSQSSFTSESSSSFSSSSSDSSSESSESTEQSETSSSSSSTEIFFSSSSSSQSSVTVSSSSSESSSTEVSETSSSSSLHSSSSSSSQSSSSVSDESSSQEFSSFSSSSSLPSSSSESSSSTEVSNTSSTESSSSSELDFLFGTLQANESIGIWLKMTIPDTESYNSSDSFTLYAVSDEETEEFNIRHTRFQQVVDNLKWIYLQNQTDFVRVKFDHVVDSEYFFGELGVFYSAFVNDDHVVDFQTNEGDIFVRNIDSIFDIDIFAIPHDGFIIDVVKESAGKSALIEFQSKRPDIFGVDKFQLFTDNQTGIFSNTIEGEMDALTGIGGGNLVIETERL